MKLRGQGHEELRGPWALAVHCGSINAIVVVQAGEAPRALLSQEGQRVPCRVCGNFLWYRAGTCFCEPSDPSSWKKARRGLLSAPVVCASCAADTMHWPTALSAPPGLVDDVPTFEWPTEALADARRRHRKGHIRPVWLG